MNNNQKAKKEAILKANYNAPRKSSQPKVARSAPKITAQFR